MKRIPVTSDELEQIAARTGRDIELTATQAFCRVGDVEYHADLEDIAAQVLEVPC